MAGAPALKASRLVSPDQPLTVKRDLRRFVSRGGEKLEAALSRFGVDVDGRLALDAGASTGGFTDCLLQRGARGVIAVDVGHGQLHERVRTDQRVQVIDRTNIRSLVPEDLPTSELPDVIVADLSFISLRTVASSLLGLARSGGELVVLIKPQFEAGRAQVSKGKGIITDPELWRSAIVGVANAIAEHGGAVVAVMASPLLGAEGNAEFLAHIRAGSPELARPDLAEIVTEAIDEAVRMSPKNTPGALGEGG